MYKLKMKETDFSTLATKLRFWSIFPDRPAILIAWKGFIAGQLERFSIFLAVCHLLTSTDILSGMLRLIKLFQRVLRGEAPAVSSYLANKCCLPYDLRRCNKVNVTSFNSYFLKTESQIAVQRCFYIFDGCLIYGFLSKCEKGKGPWF